jgi:hypothetical protein
MTRATNQDNAPSAFLAGATLANVPATNPPGQRTLTATFPTPASVVAGTRYALVITKRQNATFLASLDQCADGNVFLAQNLGDPFFPTSAVDLHFETVVVA